MTEEWTSPPRRPDRASIAISAVGFVTADIESAMSTSSVCRRGLEFPRCSTFRCWIGARTIGAMRFTRSWMPASVLRLLSRAAEHAPIRPDVLPVTIRPSGSSIAAAGAPVSSAFLRAAGTQGRMSGVREELAQFSIYNITQELIEQRKLGVVFQNMDASTVVIFYGDNKKELDERAETALTEVQKTVKELLFIDTTAGVGEDVSDIMKLYQSFEKAKAALELRWLLGGSRILWSEMLDASKSAPIDVSHWAERVLAGVKAGNTEIIEKEVRGFAQELRERRTNRTRSIIYMQNLLLSVINSADLEEEQENEIYKEEKELMNRLYTYERLRDMSTDIIAICGHLSRLLNEQRDSYGKKQAARAQEYIERNYMNSDVTLNSVCTYLAMSTSYFSTMFKTHTGETFIEALTKKRMEKAKQLLENTSKRAYEVAEEVGFSDPHYFSVAFKKATGKTPTEYAKEKRKK